MPINWIPVITAAQVASLTRVAAADDGGGGTSHCGGGQQCQTSELKAQDHCCLYVLARPHAAASLRQEADGFPSCTYNYIQISGCNYVVGNKSPLRVHTYLGGERTRLVVRCGKGAERSEVTVRPLGILLCCVLSFLQKQNCSTCQNSENDSTNDSACSTLFPLSFRHSLSFPLPSHPFCLSGTTKVSGVTYHQG